MYINKVSNSFRLSLNVWIKITLSTKLININKLYFFHHHFILELTLIKDILVKQIINTRDILN